MDNSELLMMFAILMYDANTKIATFKNMFIQRDRYSASESTCEIIEHEKYELDPTSLIRSLS